MKKIVYDNRGYTYSLDLDTDDPEFENSIDSFLNDYDIADKTGYNILFKLLVNDLHVNKFDDISDDSFLNYFRKLKKLVPTTGYGKSTQRRVIFGYINFVRYLIEEHYIQLYKYTPQVLGYKGIIKRLEEGYEVINYSPYVVIPDSSKILVDISTFQELGTQRTSSRFVYSFDFSDIKNKMIIQEILYYVFIAPTKFASKYNNVNIIMKMAKILDDDYESNAKTLAVTAKHINQFKQMNKNLSDPSKFVNLSTIRSFLDFIKERKVITIDPNLLLFLQQHNVNSDGNVLAYTKNEINQILKNLISTGFEKDKMYWYLVKIQSNTPLRISSIINLKIDCLKDINGTGKYLITFKSKTSTADICNVDKNTASLINNAIQEFKHNRISNAISIKDLIFVYRSEKTRKFSKISQSEYSFRINEICKESGINTLGQAGIRNYYNQRVTQYVEDTDKNIALISHLSKHTLNVHLKNYSDPSKLTEKYEKFYHVSSIGDIDLNISLTHKQYNEEKVVENGLGFCESDHCNDMSMFGCFMCQFFKVAQTNIPFYKKAIEGIDKEIIEENIPHEKEFLVIKKRIFVKILEYLESYQKDGD